MYREIIFLTGCCAALASGPICSPLYNVPTPPPEVNVVLGIFAKWAVQRPGFHEVVQDHYIQPMLAILAHKVVTQADQESLTALAQVTRATKDWRLLGYLLHIISTMFTKFMTSPQFLFEVLTAAGEHCKCRSDGRIVRTVEKKSSVLFDIDFKSLCRSSASEMQKMLTSNVGYVLGPGNENVTRSMILAARLACEEL